MRQELVFAQTSMIAFICVTPDYLLMGSMHPQGVPQNLVDSLSLCTKEDLALLENIVRYMVLRQEHDWNNDNFI